MIFIYPWVLLLLLLLVFFYSAKKYSKIEQVFSREILSKLQLGGVKGNLKFYFLVLSFCFMVLALARPVILSNDKKQVDVKSFNFVIALDISKSMEAKDVFPTRLAFAKKAIDGIMDRVPEANIALIAYANDAFLVSPFTNDFKSIKFLLANLDSNSLSSKGSQILSALKATNKVFKSTNDKKKALVLVSDGADGRGLESIKKYINQNDITLHVLSIGTKKGTTLSDGLGGLIKDKNNNIVISKRDDSLAKVLNGGAYLSSSGELTKLDWFAKEIKNSVDKKEVKRDKFKGAQELFYYPLVLSLFFIFFAFNALRIPFLLVLFFVQVDSRADAFDFVDIYKAKKSYEKKEYQKAEKGFAKIDNKNAKYNQANSLYKQKKFNEALKAYKSINGFSKEKEHKLLHNIGNTYANLGKIDKAIKSYEEALKLKEDKDTKANLKYMKKKKKEKEKKQKKKDNKKSKDNKKKQEQKKKKKSDQKQKDDKKKEKQKKSDANKEKKNKNKSDKKEQKKSQETPKKEQKKMSEAEAKKWEKRMDNQKFKTKPMILKKGEPNEIYW